MSEILIEAQVDKKISASLNDCDVLIYLYIKINTPLGYNVIITMQLLDTK